jgi:hypothetical protein
MANPSANCRPHPRANEVRPEQARNMRDGQNAQISTENGERKVLEMGRWADGQRISTRVLSDRGPGWGRTTKGYQGDEQGAHHGCGRLHSPCMHRVSHPSSSGLFLVGSASATAQTWSAAGRRNTGGRANKQTNKIEKREVA